MSYYVEYNPELTKRYPSRQNASAVTVVRIIVGILVLSTLICCFSVQQIRDFLIPGDPGVTIQAASELVDDIKNGEGWIYAFSAFCKTVVTDGAE